jgi:serine/threonine-protein kinase
MGVVYEARDPALDRLVALKTVAASSLSRAERKRYEKRFLAEARAAARLSHPGIVVVHDVGRDRGSGLLYMALERLEGETLAEIASSGRRLEWRDALRITGRVAEALHHAHAQGVVHRDVKPANIMVLRSGEPKVMDFGIARVDAGHFTTPGELFGTPLFMAPEQALGQPANARSDIFSLGTTAYTLLTGQAPFAGPSVPAILARVAHRSAPPPSELAPALPPALDVVLARAMAKEPGDRYPTGQALAEDIGDVLGGRSPRHCAGWRPTEGGDRTVASGGVDRGLLDLDITDERPSAPRPRRRWRSRLERIALAALAGAAAYHFWLHPEDAGFWVRIGREAHRRVSARTPPAPLPEPSSSPTALPASTPVTGTAAEAQSPGEPSPGLAAVAADEETSASAPRPSTAEVWSPSPEVAGASVEPAAPTLSAPAPSTAVQAAPPSTSNEVTPPISAGPLDTGASAAPATTPATPATREEPAPAPTPAPPPKRPPKKKPAGTTPRKPASAWLSVGFEHHLASGTLEVWVDGKRVARESLDSKVTRKLLGLELRSGSLQQTLVLDAGRHEVRVRVRSGDDDRTARSTATFRSGTTRRLEVKVPRLRGGLTLEWK